MTVTRLSELDLSESLIDLDRMYLYRLRRVQQALLDRDVSALITYDPVNTRYATGIRNMQAWALHTVIRMGFIPAEGQATLFEYAGSEHLADELPTVKEVRPSVSLQFGPGLAISERDARLSAWTKQVTALLELSGASKGRVAVDNQVPYSAVLALKDKGYELVDGYSIMCMAHNIKSEDELRAMTRSIRVAELGIGNLKTALTPGRTENQLWAELNYANIAHGGEYMDTRLLSSGQRTNPWYQECGSRVIESVDMVALDTDMIGPYGYDADISRSFVCDVEKATDRQKSLYTLAYEHVQHNIDAIAPGLSFRELSERGFKVPQIYRPQSIPMHWHGVSLYGGWPNIPGNGWFYDETEDGVLEPGMTLCVESYMGEVGGPDGVKLEEQVLVTEDGVRNLGQYPFEPELLQS